MTDFSMPRQWVRRTRGRRKADRLPSVEAVLTACVVLAWAWGGYELAQLFIK
jgi:hypothetical protein